MKKNSLLILVAILFSYSVTGQKIPDELGQRLVGKTRLQDIMKEVNAFYQYREDNNIPTPKSESKYKFWKRWEHHLSSRIGPGGEFVNITQKTLDALRVAPKLPTERPAGVNLSTTVSTTYGDWSFIGPNLNAAGNDGLIGLGRVDRMAFHPTDAAYIYAGASGGGLWRSTNSGTSWGNISSYLPSLGISGIVVVSTNTIYVLSGDGDSNLGNNGFVQNFGYIRPSAGVWKTTDGGVTWTQQELTTGTYYGFKLAVNPLNSNELLAATTAGLFRTTNGGGTWTEVRAGKHTDVAFRPSPGSYKAYACGDGFFVYSTNGTTWNTNATFNLALSGGRCGLAVTEANENYIYLLNGGTGTGTFGGVYRSTTSNTIPAFTRRSNSPNVLSSDFNGADNVDFSDYGCTISASNTNAERIIVGSCVTWKSTNGGTTMTNMTGYWVSDPGDYLHPDIHSVAYNPFNDDIYVGGDGGVSKSTDNGVNFIDVSQGIAASQIYHMAGFPGDEDKLLLGQQDNGINYRKTATSTFTAVAGGDGFDVAINRNDATQGIFSVNKSFYKFTNSGLGAANIDGISPSGVDWYPTAAIHVFDPDTIWAGYADIRRSYNRGASWTTLTGNSGTWSMCVCPSNATRLYATGGSSYSTFVDGEVYRSDDLGTNWVNISDNPGFPTQAQYDKLTDVQVNQTSSLQVWVTLGGYYDGRKVYRSDNAGASWTNVSGTLPNVPVNCIAVDGGNNAYVGTDIGVFYRGAGMNDWTPFYNYMPRVPVTELIINANAGLLRAGTFGRGVWSTDIASTCAATVTINYQHTGYKFFEASSNIASTALFYGGDVTKVFYKSGNSITLSPGFEVPAGNEFKGFIGTCGVGGIPTMKESLPTSERGRFDVRNYILPVSKKTSYPYGNVAVHPGSLKVKIFKEGNYTLQVTDLDGNVIKVLENTRPFQLGTFHLNLDKSGLSKNQYYVQMLYNDMLVAFQELEIK